MAEEVTIRRIKLRTKTSGPVEGVDQILDREIFLGETEKAIFYKQINGDYLKFGSISTDDTVFNTNTTWSSQTTKNYIDNEISNLNLLVINDDTSSTSSVWSSSKIDDFVTTSIDNIDLPVPLEIIDNTSVDTTSVWSRSYTKNYVDTEVSSIDLTEIIDDSTSSSNLTWSSEYIENYINTTMPTIPVQYRQILLNASSITPSPFGTEACDYPIVIESNNDNYIWNAVNFDTGEVGFWNLSVPHDYTGYISDIIIIYESDPSEEVTWKFDVFISQDDTDPLIDAVSEYSATHTNTSNTGTGRKLNIFQINNDVQFFGGNNINRMCSIKLTLNSGATTNPVKLYQVKLIYKA